jgi:hypothetical protein
MLDDPGLYPEQNKTYSRNCWFRTFLEAIKCLLPRPHQPSLTAISQSSQSLSGGLKCVHHFACIYSQIVIIHSIHISYCIPRYEYPQVSPKDWYIYILMSFQGNWRLQTSCHFEGRVQGSKAVAHLATHNLDMDVTWSTWSTWSTASPRQPTNQYELYKLDILITCVYYIYIRTNKLLWYIILIWSYLDVLYMWIITKPLRNSPEMSGTIL